MSRHVAHVEGKGFPTPARVRRQRRILAGLSQHQRALPRSAGAAPPQLVRPIASFGFSLRTSPEEAVAALSAALDGVDPEWRSYVRVWDGLRSGRIGAVTA